MSLLYSNDNFGEYPNSLYAFDCDLPLKAHPSLTGTETTDVAIIGGGFTGLSSAIHLMEKGISATVIDAHRMGFGASGRNGGQLGSGHRQSQTYLEKAYGVEMAKILWKYSEAAKQIFYDLIKKYAIEVDYTAGIIQADRNQKTARSSINYALKLNKEYDYDNILPLDKQRIRELIDSNQFFGGYLDIGTGHINPLKLVLGMVKAAKKLGIRLYEKSPVLTVKPGATHEIITKNGTIKAKHVIIATNGYNDELYAPNNKKIVPINNFIVATEPLSDEILQRIVKNNYAICDSRFVVNYWRLSKDNRLVFGGGENYRFKFPKDIRILVRKPMLEIYPFLKDTNIDYAWGGTLAITRNRLPYFDRSPNNIWTACGYSGHGILMGIMAGRTLAKAIAGESFHFELMQKLKTPSLPLNGHFRQMQLAIALYWYHLLDKFGF